jgi:hypothetical protein
MKDAGFEALGTENDGHRERRPQRTTARENDGQALVCGSLSSKGL